MPVPTPKKTTVIYHAYCSDGFGAAFAFWKKFGDSANYIPATHGDPPPKVEKDSEVFIVDFSFPRKVLLDMRRNCSNLVLIDHHLSAKKKLDDLDFTHFDLDKSGAVLAWEYCHPTAPVPKMLQYIQDRDLWQWRLPDSHEISAYIHSLNHEFGVWDQVAGNFEEDIDKLRGLGQTLRDAEKRFVELQARHVRLIEFEGHRVPALNSPLYHSDTGHLLLNLHRSSPFAILWFINAAGQCILSFRSRGDFDVAALATKFGGGGHPAASGCQLKAPPRNFFLES